MTDAVKRMLMGQANKDYMKKVEERKQEEKELQEEINKMKEQSKEKEAND